ncbi:homoserine O-acetyltransferase [Ceraceosorus guamensis]|uniref:Homoserine O-acetyltransferase n=1 Tax=Ceraceosorus guamensis TaxID=1522189 RepID=A0A316W759_9BASI|nr:homoserine O-acetyltransferase [Ceraceosorus guamensis]PWN43893.1 homoserine O-acetyltransferase [Ceraceosorus guamensis]
MVDHPGQEQAMPASTSQAALPIAGPTSPQSAALGNAATGGQSYLLLPSFTLESGVELQNVPVAYKTWGKLSASGDNAMVVCHALTGSADIEDWWGPLLGPSRVFDPTRFLVVCLNVLGSPYGSASPCTRRGGEVRGADGSERAGRPVVHADADGKETVHWWGPEFPATSVRDDVRIHKLVLDHLGVTQIAAVVGGSMGGMAVLEWPLCFPVRFPTEESASVPQGAAASTSATKGADRNAAQPQRPYIRAIVPIATAARHSAWCISWAEAQRQSIYSDPAYNHGYYMPSAPPRAGLSAARMAALLTYRSRDSFESRFGRRTGGPAKGNGKVAAAEIAALSVHDAAGQHNEGNSSPRTHAVDRNSSSPVPTLSSIGAQMAAASVSEGPNGTVPPSLLDPAAARNALRAPTSTVNAPKVYSAQSYLRYQGDKFVKRFDANCYVHLTRKMDTHDVARGREDWTFVDETERESEVEGNEDDEALARVLSHLSSSSATSHGPPPPRVLIVSIQSDGLFMPTEQQLMYDLIKGSELVTIESPEGHDAFLIERYMLSYHVGTFLANVLSNDDLGPNLYAGAGVGEMEWSKWNGDAGYEGGDDKVQVKESVYGEVEDVTRW